MDRLLSDEREVHHFGFSSTFLISELRTSIIHNITSMHKGMGNCIIRKLSLSDEAEKSIHREMENLSDLYKTKLDESIKKHKEGIRELFAIPENISFTSCEMSEELENENSGKLREEIKHLEEQYERDKKLLYLYKEELKSYDCNNVLTEQVTKYLEQLKTYHSDANADLTVDGCLKDYEELVNNHVNHYKIKRDIYKNKYKTQDERVLLPN